MMARFFCYNASWIDALAQRCYHRARCIGACHEVRRRKFHQLNVASCRHDYCGLLRIERLSPQGSTCAGGRQVAAASVQQGLRIRTLSRHPRLIGCRSKECWSMQGCRDATRSLIVSPSLERTQLIRGSL